MTSPTNPLGHMEFDPSGFNLFPHGPDVFLRHTCGWTEKVDPSLSLYLMTTSAVAHRFTDGCNAQHRPHCGRCRRDFEPGEHFRHDTRVWVHVPACPEDPSGLAGSLAVEPPAPPSQDEQEAA